MRERWCRRRAGVGVVRVSPSAPSRSRLVGSSGGFALEAWPSAEELRDTIDDEAMLAPDLKLAEGRWIDAGRLQVGYQLRLADGGFATVLSVRSYHDEIVVYNFKVAEFRNYAVGSLAILVHNNPECPIELRVKGEKIADDVSVQPRPDLKVQSTKRNPDGTKKSPFDQLDEIMKA